MTRAPASATCPRCGAWAPLLPIVFGYPLPETFAAAERGEIALGGCVVSGEDPTHQCTACDQEVILEADPPLVCVSCGRPLLGDPDEDPTGESKLPICGDCDRARNFDAIEEPAWLADDGET